MIICMLVAVRALTYPILDILHYIPQNACLHYLMFSMSLTLPNRCYLFKNSAVKHILRYLRGTTLHGLHITRSYSFALHGFTDVA
jgi:hypothetical protein